MIRHVVLSGIFIGLGLGLIILICTKYDPRPKTIKRFTIAAILTLGGVTALSYGANTTSGACPDDPSEICRYNDSTPAIVFVVTIFVIVCAIRSRMIYFER